MREQISRRTVVLAAGVAGVLAASGCASLMGGPRTVSISKARLTELVGRQFPQSQRYMELFDVTMTEPRVWLIPTENRIGTELRYSLGASVLSERQMSGSLSMSYGLRFEPADATLRLDKVKVQKFDLEGLPKAYAGRAPQLGRLLAQSVLQDLVVHRLEGADLRRVQEASLRPGALKVLPDGLQLQLEPVPR